MSLINGDPSPTTIILIIVLIAVSVGIRIYIFYLRRKYKIATAKCPKCGTVFVPPASRFVFRPYRTVECPACGETSRMRLGTEPATWPKEDAPKEELNEKEDLERRIQESKYSK
jgi:Zn ribbon nucleic-acid-binding protein